MARISTSRNSRSSKIRSKIADEDRSASVALLKAPSVDATAVALRDEVMRQAAFGFQQLTMEIANERRERERFQRIITIGLSGLGALLVLATIVLLSSIGSSVRDTLAYEMAELTSTTARTIRAGTEPVQETVERQSEMMKRAADMERLLVSLYGYEHLAMSGSRQAFVELRKLATRQDDAGIIARDRMAQITSRYAVLATPQRGNIRVGEFSVIRGDSTLRLTALTSAELVYVLGSPDATLNQVHQVMSLLWDRPLDKGLERELWSLLQRSNNLPASVAICSLLKGRFGTRATMYDFDTWRSFLAKRL
jgi:hypothetical protein